MLVYPCRIPLPLFPGAEPPGPAALAGKGMPPHTPALAWGRAVASVQLRGQCLNCFLQQFLPLTGAKWLSALGKPSSSCCWVGLALCSGATGAVVCLVSHQQHFTRKLVAGLFSWLESEEGETPPCVQPQSRSLG